MRAPSLNQSAAALIGLTRTDSGRGSRLTDLLNKDIAAAAAAGPALRPRRLLAFARNHRKYVI